jgi:hypothetical protein
MWTDVSEEFITSIFKVENQNGKKPAFSRWLDLYPENEGDTCLRNIGWILTYYVAPRSPYGNRRFGEIYHLHLQGRESE